MPFFNKLDKLASELNEKLGIKSYNITPSMDEKDNLVLTMKLTKEFKEWFKEKYNFKKFTFKRLESILEKL